jgi:fatty acid desaturase
VTCNHQTEEIITKDASYCYVTDNFETTRGVRCDDIVTEYLFGGMQYQLEHHLFPTMPRYYYPKLRPILKAFSVEQKLPFKVSGVTEIMVMNYNVIKKYTGEGKSILDINKNI